MIAQGILYLINEGFDDPKPVRLIKDTEWLNGKAIGEGIVQTANEKNRNGRWYWDRDLFPQLICPRTVELLENGYMRAEMGHPLDKSLARQSTIDDTKTCARFLKFWTEGNDVWARFVATNNVNGRAFDLDLKEGCKPAWSLRALGVIEQTRNGAEVHNLRLITYDQVIYPSHPGAYTQRLVTENASVAVSEGAGLNDTSGKALLFPVENKDVITYIQNESASIKFLQEYFDFVYDDIKVNESGTKVTLRENNGNLIVVPLERHIHNEFMTYAANEIASRFWEE